MYRSINAGIKEHLLIFCTSTKRSPHHFGNQISSPESLHPFLQIYTFKGMKNTHVMVLGWDIMTHFTNQMRIHLDLRVNNSYKINYLKTNLYYVQWSNYQSRNCTTYCTSKQAGVNGVGLTVRHFQESPPRTLR
eukprot:TRINITY_DN5070_c0_g1_i10.p2 TRINITY_DN5070_c0_g1~~TRINITY_DN5070_c0_g1_i10.p2  ORF type:complete len:134 (+),score=11.17 TRINITY_DN5070_c0_g1_i10:442-843(+)